MLAPHRLELAWRAALPLLWDVSAGLSSVEERTLFEWYEECKGLRSRLEVTARQWDPAADFYRVEPLPAMASDADAAARKERADLLAALPKWLPHLFWARGSLAYADGSWDAALLLEYLVAPRVLAINRGPDSDFVSLLGTLESGADGSSQSRTTRAKLRPKALAAGLVTFCRSLFPQSVIATFHAAAPEREGQLQSWFELAAAVRKGSPLEIFVDAHADTILKVCGSLRALIGTRPALWGMQLSDAVRILAPASAMPNGRLLLSTV